MNPALGFAAGALTGAISGMPLGVVNVAIVDAAFAREKRYAMGLGIGGALADTVHASLAFLGLATVITAHPELERIVALASGLIIVVFAIASWRRQRGRKERTYEHPTVARGIASGAGITLPNPAALAAWLAVASGLHVGSTAAGIAAAAGAGIGSALWFIALGKLVARASPENRLLELIPKFAIIIFVAIAAVGIVRVFS